MLLKVILCLLAMIIIATFLCIVGIGAIDLILERGLFRDEYDIISDEYDIE